MEECFTYIGCAASIRRVKQLSRRTHLTIFVVGCAFLLFFHNRLVANLQRTVGIFEKVGGSTAIIARLEGSLASTCILLVSWKGAEMAPFCITILTVIVSTTDFKFLGVLISTEAFRCLRIA